jgi:hypothetical protein
MHSTVRNILFLPLALAWLEFLINLILFLLYLIPLTTPLPLDHHSLQEACQVCLYPTLLLLLLLHHLPDISLLTYGAYNKKKAPS